MDGSKGSCCYGGGFKEELSGYLYITRFQDDELNVFNKTGVSNGDPAIRNNAQNRKANYNYQVTPLCYIFFEKGEDALLLEKELTRLYNSGIVVPEVFPDGYTETITCSEESLRDLWGDLLIMTGCSIFGEYTQKILPKDEEFSLNFKGKFWLVDVSTLDKIEEDLWK